MKEKCKSFYFLPVIRYIQTLLDAPRSAWPKYLAASSYRISINSESVKFRGLTLIGGGGGVAVGSQFLIAFVNLVRISSNTSSASQRLARYFLTRIATAMKKATTTAAPLAPSMRPAVGESGSRTFPTSLAAVRTSQYVILVYILGEIWWLKRMEQCSYKEVKLAAPRYSRFKG